MIVSMSIKRRYVASTGAFRSYVSSSVRSRNSMYVSTVIGDT